MRTHFDHEKLKAYQASISFVAWTHELLESVPSKASVKDQLDRASTSVPLNIAEGNGKSSYPDRARYFSIANGSALESAACLDVLRAKNLISPESVEEGKSLLLEIVSMVRGLIDRFSERVREGSDGSEWPTSAEIKGEPSAGEHD